MFENLPQTSREASIALNIVRQRIGFDREKNARVLRKASGYRRLRNWLAEQEQSGFVPASPERPSNVSPTPEIPQIAHSQPTNHVAAVAASRVDSPLEALWSAVAKLQEKAPKGQEALMDHRVVPSGGAHRDTYSTEEATA